MPYLLRAEGVRPWRSSRYGATPCVKARPSPPCTSAISGSSWSGNFVSQCGDQIQLVGLAILALDLTHNPATLGAVLAAQAIPRTLFILLGGVVTDRFRASGVLRVTNLVMAFLVGVLATLTALRLLEVWHVYVYAVLAGMVYACAIPAQQSIPSDLVPPRQGTSRGRIEHDQLQHDAVPRATPRWAPGRAPGKRARLRLQRLVVWHCCALPPVPTGDCAARPGAQARSNCPVPRGIRRGLRIPVLLIAALTAIVYSLGYQGANLVGVPTLAKLTFAAGDAGVGLLYGAGGAGALLAALGTGLVARIPRLGLLAGLTLLGTGISLALVGAATTVPEAVLVLFLATGARAICATAYLTLVQIHAPAEVRGRVMALFMFGAVGLEPLSLSIEGLLGVTVGGRGIFLVCGIAIALAGVLATGNRAFRTTT